MLSDAPLTLPAAKYRPTLTKTEKSNRTNQVSWKAVRTHERIAPLTRSSPCEDYCDALRPLEHAIKQLTKVNHAA
jgi:hypothetical protein